MSYSKLDLFEQCQLRYYLKYILKMYTFNNTIATEVGSLLHKCLELKAHYIMNQEPVDYETLLSTLELGCLDDTPTGIKLLKGTADLRKHYIDDWYVPDRKSGMDYDEKINLFINQVLTTRIEDKNVIGAEVPFEFVYNDRVILHGFIDRVDKINNCYKVIDYKSSKSVFPEAKIKTPMQFVIYDLACLYLYDSLPFAHEYDFIVLDKKQTEETGLCTKGYLKRGIKKLDRILDQMETMQEFRPKPSPLCYWCDYSLSSPTASEKYNNKCPYYSLWTPEKPTFKVNQLYIKGESNNENY